MNRTSPRSRRLPRGPANRSRRGGASSGKFALSILAGGNSKRMGRNKARMRLRGKSLLGWVKAAAMATGWPVRVIRRDRWPGRGPLGGVHTALSTARTDTDAEVFLACDMPFVSVELLRHVFSRLGARDAVFASVNGVPGFPFAVRTRALAVVEAQLRDGKLSLRELAQVLRARLAPVPARMQHALTNLNTLEEWAQAAER